MNNELRDNGLTEGFDPLILDEMLRVMKAPNIYIWCNAAQIPQYMEYFVGTHGCKFDILCWVKTNAAPLFNNKYLTDKEYCLYFRRGGYCQPENYDAAKTVFFQPKNVKDKELWIHPTIKPLNIIKRLIANSSKYGDIVLDPFMGSGTTAVAAQALKRNYIGFEINPVFHAIAENRVKIEASQPELFSC